MSTMSISLFYHKLFFFLLFFFFLVFFCLSFIFLYKRQGFWILMFFSFLPFALYSVPQSFITPVVYYPLPQKDTKTCHPVSFKPSLKENPPKRKKGFGLQRDHTPKTLSPIPRKASPLYPYTPKGYWVLGTG